MLNRLSAYSVENSSLEDRRRTSYTSASKAVDPSKPSSYIEDTDRCYRQHLPR